jgi:hypothetical protein
VVARRLVTVAFIVVMVYLAIALVAYLGPSILDIPGIVWKQ